MQKISSYLLKNRIELVADLAGFITEWKIVYQRQIKLYSGIDNTLEFDIKNADQKRIDLSTFGDIELHIMDNTGQALPNSPYLIAPTALQGIAAVTIPKADLALEEQFLSFTVATTKDAQEVLLYGDTRFGATGAMELITTAMPTTRGLKTYDYWHGIGDFNNTTITYFSSGIPLKFRDALPPTLAEIKVNVNQLDGQVWVEATKDEVIGNESFTYKGHRLDQATVTPGTFQVVFTDINIEGYTWIRVNYTKDPTVTTGKATDFTIEYYRA